MDSILLVDDDIELCEMLKLYLETEGFWVGLAHSGKVSLAQVQSGKYALMVLDVMMPELNGFDVLRELRKESMVPVLMLTARNEDVDSIVGLELGADDYLPKPCNPRVLVARIRAILRRAQSQEQHSEEIAKLDALELNDLVIQTGSRDVILNGQRIAMTSTEYSVLEVLLRAAGPFQTTDNYCLNHQVQRKM